MNNIPLFSPNNNNPSITDRPLVHPLFHHNRYLKCSLNRYAQWEWPPVQATVCLPLAVVQKTIGKCDYKLQNTHTTNHTSHFTALTKVQVNKFGLTKPNDLKEWCHTFLHYSTFWAHCSITTILYYVALLVVVCFWLLFNASPSFALFACHVYCFDMHFPLCLSTACPMHL